MFRSTGKSRCRKTLKDSAGFTFIETVVGLAVLLVVVGIMGLFLIPPVRDAPSISEGVRNTASIAQLQSQFLQISNDLHIPFWWPSSYVESSATKVIIKNLGNRYIAKPTSDDYLLSIEIKNTNIEINYKNTIYNYNFEETPKLNVIMDSTSNKGLKIQLTIPANGREEYTLFLPLEIIQGSS